AVSVSYTETLMSSSRDPMGVSQAASGRVRTFRKLYQFIAQPCLSVRTKTSELPPLEVDNRSLGPYGKTRLLRFALEAQLENVGDGAIVLGVRFWPGICYWIFSGSYINSQAQATTLNPKPPFKSRSLNWDFERPDSVRSNPPLLNP